MRIGFRLNEALCIMAAAGVLCALPPAGRAPVEIPVSTGHYAMPAGLKIDHAILTMASPQADPFHSVRV